MGSEKVPPDQAADAVDFTAETGGVEFVGGQREEGKVVGFVWGGMGSGDGALDQRLGCGVCRGDLHFLEKEEVGEGVPAKEVAERGAGWGRRFGDADGGLGGGRGEEGCDLFLRGLEEGSIAVDVPGVDAESGVRRGAGVETAPLDWKGRDFRGHYRW